MKIKWLGNTCFMITSNNGTVVLTNPYQDMLPCFKPEKRMRIVTSSRGNDGPYDGGSGAFRYINAPGLYALNGMMIKGVETTGGGYSGEVKEKNIVYNMRIDGLSVCHCGELVQPLDAWHVAAIGKVDILCLPIGGGFSLDPRSAAEVVRQLRPAVAVPMHYVTGAAASSGLLPGKVGSFISASERKASTYDTLEVSPATIRERAGIAVLKYYLS